MNSFLYKENLLLCEDIPLKELAEEYGTPLYVYSKKQLTENYRVFRDILDENQFRVLYALKANANPSLLKILAAEGAGADVVSAGEIFLALKAGFSPERIVFAGAGKREEEIEYALKQNIHSFNVESADELQIISRTAIRSGTHARISLRINPDVDAQSHPYITTGMQSTKFGIEASKALEVYKYASTLSSLKITGIHSHIGSQITKVDPFIAAAQCIAGLVAQLHEAQIHLTHIDIGGGFGIPYTQAVSHEALPNEEQADSPIPSPEEFLHAILPVLQPTDCSIWIEPGRSIVANTGVLLTRVLFVKEHARKKFIIVDSGMNDLIRPSLYQAYHQIVPLAIDTYEYERGDIVGPICENSDFFARDRLIAKVHPGDFLAVMSTGAYGYVLSSNYNGRPRPAEILVNGERVRVIRPRQSLEEL